MVSGGAARRQHARDAFPLRGSTGRRAGLARAARQQAVSTRSCCWHKHLASAVDAGSMLSARCARRTGTEAGATRNCSDALANPERLRATNCESAHVWVEHGVVWRLLDPGISVRRHSAAEIVEAPHVLRIELLRMRRIEVLRNEREIEIDPIPLGKK